MNTKKLFLLFLQISIITCPISVSISQLFLGLSFFTFLSDSERRKNWKFSPLIGFAFLLFGWYFLSFLFNHSYRDPIVFFNDLKKSEFKDFLLFGAFFMTATLEKDETPVIQKAFGISLLVLIISGFVSIFSLYRFSYLFNSLFREVTTWPYQHHNGRVLGIELFLPIGFMNTHLTFGGILMFFFPFAFYKFFSDLIKKNSNRMKSGLLLLVFMVVFLLNNARSAIVGTGIAILFGYIDLSIQKEESIRFLNKYIFKVLGIFFVLLIILSTIPTFRKTISPFFGNEKHTDFGRTFIWHSSFPLVQNSPIIGIGPGNYSSEIDRSRLDLSEKNREHVFFYEVTQRGHAHNDYFHLGVISGYPGILFYIGLLYSILFSFSKLKAPMEKRAMFYGILSIFPAGLLQCYFQDDEVVIVFWYLLGFFQHYIYLSSESGEQALQI